MDNLIAKPLKRLFSNSTVYAKRQISDIYNINKDFDIKSVQYSVISNSAIINMTDMKNNTNVDYNKNDLNCDSFDDSLKTKSFINSIDSDVKVNDFDSPNKIKVLTTKIVEQPIKNVVKYVNNKSNASNPDNIEINNDLDRTSHELKKKVPVIKIKVKLMNNNNIKKTNRNKIDEDKIISENKTHLIEHITNNSEVKETINTTNDLQIEEDPEKKDTSIFDSNLSPIPVVPSPAAQKFRPVGELIDFHERQVHQTNGKLFQNAKTLPRMGTSALLNRSIERKTSLTDPEIISAMVYDRFIINLYESRSYKRQFKAKKPTTYGRIFKSLERDITTVPNFDNTYNKEFKKDIICMKQSSPIKLKDQYVSLSPKNTILNNEHDRDNTDEEILDENQFIEHLTLHEEKSSSSEIIFSQTDENIDVSGLHIKCFEATGFEKEDRNKTNEESDIYPNSNDSKTIDIVVNKPLESLTETEPSSYNMEEFLKKALGEELNKYDSHLDSTIEVESKEKEKIINPDVKQILHEESMCTSDASDLISKINTLQSTFYRSLTKKLQHMSDTLKIPSAPKHEKEEKICDDLEVIFPNNERVTELVRQAAVQYESIKQITKALTVCRNSKEFSASPEQVEGERLLLIAAYKRQVILDEIRRLDYEVEESTSTAERGTVLISGLTLPLKEDTADHMMASRRDYSRWYVCIFSCGPRVFATQPILGNAKANVYFSEEVIFTELPTDFTINVEVYCLLQRRPNRNFSHESKYHINKETKNTHCPSPKKFLHREKSKNKIPTRFDTGIRVSSFKSCGSLKLRVADLCKSGEWYMRKVPLCSVLNGSIFMNLQSMIKIPVKYCGFLTVGTEAEGSAVWNRRWCVLDGHKLRYWNYPCDEDTRKPLRDLDLKYCVNAFIETANRELCARPRTLLIETARLPKSNDSNSLTVSCVHKSYTIERNFLSADCVSDLRTWELHLNIVIRAIRTWNAGYLK